MSEFWWGVLVCGITVFLFIMALIAGGALTQKTLATECNRYGKTQIEGVWYRCVPMSPEPKKGVNFYSRWY